MDIAILTCLALTLAVLVFLAWRLVKDMPDRANLARLQTREQDYQAACQQLQEKSQAFEDLQAQNAKLAADLANEKRGGTEKLKLLEDAEGRLKKEFENLANRIFEDKGKVITEQNKERISGILQPFKDQLESFRKRADQIHQSDTEQSARLLEKVRQLQDLSNKVSDEANNLAQAIKGDAKRQGDWGELIVERIFEASGLERGREYEAQETIRAQDGSLQRPDFVVNLPGDKAVIVDSKVSLTAFERFCAAEEEPARDKALAEHLQSIRQHVGDLRAKNYGALLGNRTLDFVLMCIPLEPAYQTALQADKDLLYDLAKSHVVITGPTTLMITLKLIAQVWRREHENRNVEIIADRAGRMYDQVALIVDAMADAEKKLGNVSAAFELAHKRLKTGKGNLVDRVEEIRKLGAKVNKQIPPAIVEAAINQASDHTIDIALEAESPTRPEAE